MKISGFSIFCLVFTFFFAQSCIFLLFENASLKRELRISEKSKDLADDQINDLEYALSNLRNEKDTVATRSFVAGIVEVLGKDKKEYLNAVWHDGYDRGASVSSYAIEKEKE